MSFQQLLLKDVDSEVKDNKKYTIPLLFWFKPNLHLLPRNIVYKLPIYPTHIPLVRLKLKLKSKVI